MPQQPSRFGGDLSLFISLYESCEGCALDLASPSASQQVVQCQEGDCTEVAQRLVALKVVQGLAAAPLATSGPLSLANSGPLSLASARGSTRQESAPAQPPLKRGSTRQESAPAQLPLETLTLARSPGSHGQQKCQGTGSWPASTLPHLTPNAKNSRQRQRALGRGLR